MNECHCQFEEREIAQIGQLTGNENCVSKTDQFVLYAFDDF